MTDVTRKASEKSKSKSGNTKGQNLNEKQNYLVSPVPELTDPKTIPFPEWSNDDISTHSSTNISAKGRDKEKTDKHEESRSFEDPQVLFLPFCLQEEECDWKRAQEIFSEYELVMYTKTNEYPDLLTGSAHLVHSPFIRSFISSVINLEYLSNTTQFPTEATTAKFTPNAEGPWKPWHHIYSGGKATPTHNPQVNTSGKYYVRLFWLGAWRKVTVDDYLPIDKMGHVLLPSLPIPQLRVDSAHTETTIASTGSKKSPRKKKRPKIVESTLKVELWPFLLSKALLKLANMTMKKDRDLNNFNLIHSLTGWVLQEVSLEYEDDVSLEEMWDIFVRCTKLYTWKSANDESKSTSPPPAKESKKKKQTKKKKKNKKKGLKIVTPKTVDAKNPHSVLVLCKDMRYPKSNTVQEIAPCWGHEIVIDECRDIPLEQPAPNPEYPLWKTFRWIEWAKSNGQIEEPVELDRTRYVKCVSPFKHFSMLKINKSDSQHQTPKRQEFPFRKSVNVLAKNVPRDSAGPPTNELTSESERSHNEETTTPRSEPTDKSKNKKGSSATIVQDPSIWVKFDDLYASLLSFDVFFKTSQFEHKARICDLELSEILKTGTRVGKKSVPNQKDKDTWQNVKCAKALQERGNVPLYFFIDSLDTKLMLINLCHSGDVGRLAPMEDELSETNFFVEYERLFGSKTKSSTDKPASPKKLRLDRPKIHKNLKPSYLLFDEYQWDDAKAGKLVSFLTTYGNSTTMLELEPGRHIFRLWTKSRFPFCITLLCDSNFTIGSFEQIVGNMAIEPMLITQFSLDISKSYAELVNSFGTDNYPTCLRNWYRSYMPKDANTILTKNERISIHNAFQDSFVQYLQSSQTPVDKILEALRTVFLNMSYCVHTEVLPQHKLSSLEIQSLQEMIICERASAKLSAFFKYVQVMTLKRRHSVNHPKHNMIFDNLKLLYSMVFSKDTRLEQLGTVIRSFFDNPTIKDLLGFYDCSKDFRLDVSVQTYTGSAEFTRDFALLCRYVLLCKKKILLNIKLFCSIPHYALCVVDNDSNEEIYRYTNEIFPTEFVPNNYGYTIIGFAWSVDIETVNWKLVIISERKRKQQFSVEESKTAMYNSFDNYVPICKSMIGKHIISLKENVLFTLRFSCSYKNLKFNIKLYDPEQNLIEDIVGKEKIILPSVLLKGAVMMHSISSWKSRVSNRSLVSKGRQGLAMRSTVSDLGKSVLGKKEYAAARKLREIASEGSGFLDDDAVTYRLEIYVVDDSWPLTLLEWENVKRLRENTYFIKRSKQQLSDAVLLPSRSGTRSGKDIRKSNLKKGESIDRPWYLLQYAFRANTHAKLEKDKTEEDETYNLKKSWYTPDPDRYQRSVDLRQKYVAQYGCLCPEEYNVSSKSWESMGTAESVTTAEESTTSRHDGGDDNVYRTTKCPNCIEVGIPPFDLTPYYRPTSASSDGERYVKTEKDHEADRINREIMLEEYDESLSKKKSDMEMWINQYQERKALVTLWYDECRSASEDIMNEYYTMRQKYLEKWRASLLPKKKETKKKKDKKSKKKKKK